MANQIFDTPLLVDEEIYALLPQRPPMVMVDRFYGLEGNDSYTGLLVNASCLFCMDGKLDECGLIEHLAQSAAVRLGYLCKKKGEPVTIGYIASVDKMKFYQWPSVGDLLYTTLRIEQEIFGITLVSATVKRKGETVAEGLLKIALKSSKE